MQIRSLHPIDDLHAVIDLQTEAQDYWLLADGVCDPVQKAADFFTDCPPNCDPQQSHRLGLFDTVGLIGIAELSFGFPDSHDAYLGLMLLAPRARGQGAGRELLAEVESRARWTKAPKLYLAVLEANPRGRAFWERSGFRATGLSRQDPDTGHRLHRLAKAL